MKLTEKQLRQIIKEELARAKRQRLTEAIVDQIVNDAKVSTVMKALAQQLCAKLGLTGDAGAIEGMLDGLKGSVAELVQARAEEHPKAN